MLSVSALTIEIGPRTLVKDASFTIGPGEKVGLVGRNGTGKSSLVSVLVGEPGPTICACPARSSRGKCRIPAAGTRPAVGSGPSRQASRTSCPPRASTCSMSRLRPRKRCDGVGPGTRPHRQFSDLEEEVQPSRRIRGRVGDVTAGRWTRVSTRECS